MNGLFIVPLHSLAYAQKHVPWDLDTTIIKINKKLLRTLQTERPLANLPLCSLLNFYAYLASYIIH